MENNIKIYFTQITQNRLYENAENLKLVYPYVDGLVIVDGGSTDGLYEFLFELANDDGCSIILEDQFPNKNSKVNIIVKKWDDNFPDSRNRYIRAIDHLRNDSESSWICQADSDEFFSVHLLNKLKTFCEWADKNKFDALQVRCKYVELYENGERGYVNYDDYWKQLIYKWNKNLYMTGNKLHEGFSLPYRAFQIPSNHEGGINSELIYEHRKSQLEVWRRAFRNVWVGGGGPNLHERNPLWIPLKNLFAECIGEMPRTWHDADTYLREGHINEKLKIWIIDHAFSGLDDYSNVHQEVKNGLSEIREMFLYYFSLHKDEIPESLWSIQKYEQLMKDRMKLSAPVL